MEDGESLDSILFTKLVVVKQLYLEATRNFENRHHIANRILAVIIYDVTVESILKLVVSELEPAKSPSSTFPKLIEQCNAVLNDHGHEPISNLSSIRQLHSVRNDAQHKAKFPTQEEVEEARVHTLDLCKQLMESLWDIDFLEVSLDSLISDPLLGDLVEAARDGIKANDPRRAVALAHLAFSWAHRSIDELVPDSTIRPLRAEQIPSLDLSSSMYLDSYMKRTERSAKRFAAMLSSGVAVVDYRRYRSLIPRLQFQGAIDSRKPNHRDLSINVLFRGRSPDLEDARWLVDFAVASIVSWQNLGLSPAIKERDLQFEARSLIEWNPDIVKIQD